MEVMTSNLGRDLNLWEESDAYTGRGKVVMPPLRLSGGNLPPPELQPQMVTNNDQSV